MHNCLFLCTVIITLILNKFLKIFNGIGKIKEPENIRVYISKR